MSNIASSILQFLPLNARVIAEVGSSDLREQYLPYNPSANFVCANNIPMEAIPTDIDCLVFTDLTDLRLRLSEIIIKVRDSGQILIPFLNAQFFQNLVNLVTGKGIESKVYTVSQIESITKEFNLIPIEIIKQNMTDAQQKSFKQFHHLLTPLVQVLQISEVQFQEISGSEYLVLKLIKQPLSQQKLLIQTCITAPIGCDRVRVMEPDRFSSTLLATRTMPVRIGQSIPLNVATQDEFKIFIWQRALLLYPQDIQKQKLLKDKGYLIVAEHDDDPFFWPENADNKFLLFWSSHCIQTSTNPLAEHLKQFNNTFVKVFPNHLAYLPPDREYSDNYTVNLFFGALNRQQDWEPIMPMINRILTRYKQVFVKVVHDQQFFDALATSRKEFHPFLPYEEYQKVLHTCDIGILPLQDTQFNRMKSDLKFLEHAGHGVVALASPTVYQNSIEEGVTGMIYRSGDEFAEKLTELVQNNELRHKIAKNAYTWLKENRLLCQHFEARREWYLEMYRRLPELNAALKERCPQMFE